MTSKTGRKDDQKMENDLDSGFCIEDSEAINIIANLKLNNMKSASAPVVKQKKVSADELMRFLESFPAAQGWVLYTDGLVNFMKRSENDRSREILELEICDAVTEAGDCRTLRAVLMSENFYSVTLQMPAGQEAPIMDKEKDSASGANWVYAFSDTFAVLKNSFRSSLDAQGTVRYRVWYRCYRKADGKAEQGRWMPWMQQFSGFVK